MGPGLEGHLPVLLHLKGIGELLKDFNWGMTRSSPKYDSGCRVEC